MSSNEPEFMTYQFDAVVDFVRPGQQLPCEVHLHTGQGTYRARTWLQDNRDRSTLPIATVTMIATGDADNPGYVVTDLAPCPRHDVFDLIPDNFAADRTGVGRLRSVVEAIAEESLRRFIARAFSLRQVFYCFWTCPASQRHHHNYPGGLAVHSLEMAEGIIANPHLTGSERDLAIVYAVLHDVGKIWCYRSDGTYGEPLGHDLALLDHLHPCLRELKVQWPDGELAMRSLLSGLWKHRGHRPIMAIGRLVQSLDQVSAEQDLRRNSRCDPRFKPWSPAKPSAWAPRT